VHFIRKIWPECPYEIVVVATDVEIAVDVPVVYLGENRNFGSNMIRFLDDHYEDEYMINWMEDYILCRVNHERVLAAERVLHRKNVGWIRLAKRFSRCERPFTEVEGVDFLCHVDRARYTFSQQIGMWKTSLYRQYLREGENSWVTEVQGSVRAHRYRGHILSVSKPVIENRNLIQKRRRDPGTVAWMKANR
jgi:hypothetical protein